MSRIAVVTLAVVLIGCSLPRAKLPVECEPPPAPEPHVQVLACDEAVSTAISVLPGDIVVHHAYFSFGGCAPTWRCPAHSYQPNFGKVVFETNDPAMRFVWVNISGRDLQGRGGPLVPHYQGEWLEDYGPPDAGGG